MAVKIKLLRLGKIRAPYYRIVVADARTRRSGRAIETIGKYHPKTDPSFIEVDSERAQYWLGVGAQPTEPVEAILKITGDWQKFKGLPGTEGTLRHPAPPVNRLERFNAALAEAGGELTDATTPKKKSEPKAKKVDAKDEKSETDAGAKKAEAKDEKSETDSGAKKADAQDEKSESKDDAKAETTTESADEKPAEEKAEVSEAAEAGQ